MVGRTAFEDIPMGGQILRRGQNVIANIGAANRDPEYFAEPGRLDITRTPNRHLSFGQGTHFCLGAPLARLEGQIAIGALLRRMKEPVLAQEELQWRPSVTFRGLKELHVRFAD
jgi:cytochrome P450